MLVSETISRRRLAGRVRRLANVERDQGHRAGVVEFDAMHQRFELYARLVQRVEDRRCPLRPDGREALECFLREQPPVRDYGVRARARNARIEHLLEELDAE